MVDADLVVRTAGLCVVLAGAETLHGIARTVLVVPRIGKERALKLSIISGSLLAFAVCYLLVPPMGLNRAGDLLLLGLVIALFMASFDVAMGRLLLRRSWAKVLDDFNPATGNYLVFGVVLLMGFPLLVMRLHD